VRRALVILLLALLACGGDDTAADTRADQVRAAAEDAGLPDDVVDVLVLAARGADGVFQVTYPGEDGTALVVSQNPPNRRIDVVAGDQVVQSRVFRGGVGYECQPPADEPTGALECSRAQGALDAPGAFTADALDAFTDDLAGSGDEVDLSVERRTIAEVDATCLVAVPKAGPADGTGPGVETLCLSDEGGQLLVDVGGERLVADAYTTDVPDGTFEI
jgi:hypothetical protein